MERRMSIRRDTATSFTDLQSDPNELNNLYDNPEYADIQTRLQARLDKFRVDQKVDEY